MGASVSPFSGNRDHYVSRLVLNPSEHVTAKPGRSALLRGLVSGCIRTSCSDTGPNT